MANGISKERTQEIAAEVRACYEEAVRDSAEQARLWDAAQRYIPTAKQRAAWYAANRTSVPEELRRASRPWWVRVAEWVVGKIWRLP